MKAVVAAFNQEKALVGAFSVITNLRMELFQELMTELTTVMVVMQVAVRLFTEDGFLLVGGDLVRDVVRYCTVLYCTVLYCTVLVRDVVRDDEKLVAELAHTSRETAAES